MFKYYIKVIIRNLLKIFWIFPIDKKKIYFQSFGGKSMNCNPWYIFKYMYEKYPDYKYVWLLNQEPAERLKNVTYVKKNTLKWVKEILTSKVLVANDGFFYYVPYRKKNIMIETWHGGGAYKKVGMAFNDENNEKLTKYISKSLNYFISSSRKFSEIMSFSRGVDICKFFPIGMPRNDVFFDDMVVNNINYNVRKKLNLTNEDFVVLYAPTFRGKINKAEFENHIDVHRLKSILYEKYQKDIKFLFRGHYFLKKESDVLEFDLNVSKHSDMQELLCISDMLITDYSSSMWDYSFLFRPCFLFVPDFDEYVKNRGFYTDPYSWGFPICKTNNELMNAIENFDQQKFVQAMKKHHEDLVSYEVGTATEKIVELIKNNL